ncbi:MAG TPA: glycine--tRNA ligase subunit beta [Terriglobales bacterium]|nr:glycine--tRNA ligase subunit beta [Terriglobales bacterium]
MPDFLLEIGCEEIPARMIDGAREELARRVSDLLQRERLAENPTMQAFSTPRRLAVLSPGVSAAQPDLREQVTGPSLKVAYKDGVPTAAAEAFARKLNIPVDALEKITTPKGEYLAATVQKKGRPAAEILAESLPKEIAGIYWAKSMYWRGKSAERFVRPVRWLVSLLEGEVVPLEFAGIRAGHTSEGHRILSSGTLEIGRPSEYSEKLAGGSVVVSAAEREQRIRKALDAATRTMPGARWRDDNALLDTVVNLTEFPSVVLGSFDPEFLALPDEVLVTVMRDHQKYFALEDENGKLLPHFLAVLNTNGDPAGLIRHGNERVLRARFNDARFFWETDQKIPLRQRVEMLKSVTFQKDLGSYFDKTRRVQKLASLISEALKSAGVSVRSGVVFKAALLAKTDLTTDLVKEFTELQGIVGGLYAKVQQLDPILPATTADAIGDAIYDQYKPESMEDRVPRTLEGAIVAIADKADSIAGMFALGLQPTGSKDPFALRRAANGIVKTIAEHKLPLPLSKLFEDTLQQYENSPAEGKFRAPFEQLVIEEKNIRALLADRRVDYTRWDTKPRPFIGPAAVEEPLSITVFMLDRLAYYLRDVRGFTYDVVSAVLAADYDDIVDAIARAEALTQIRGSVDFASVAAAFKRIKNIIRQAQENNKAIANQLDSSALTEEAEKQLAAVIPEMASSARKLREEKNYSAALLQISQLRKPVDLFFDKVMVMVDDESVRANRLALLRDLLNEFSTIADFSEIVTEGSKESPSRGETA